MRQTILFSKIYPVLTQAIFKEISWPEYWSVLLNKESFWCFFFKFWAGFSLHCAGLHAAWHLLGSYHTETHHFSPLLLGIKIIIVKFLLTITTLKIQSDCFGIKRSRKRPTDCSLQQTLPIYYDTWRWNVIKDSKFQPSLVDKKVFKMWLLLSVYNIYDFILLAWGPECVLPLSCVVHGPIYGRFMGFYVNGFLSILRLPCFVLKSFHFRRLQKR